MLGITGLGAAQIDFLHAVYANFPLMLLLIAALTYLLLARAFRSLLLPLKAVLLNIVSLAATLGLMVLFWQDGHGSKAIFGIAGTGAVTFWIPMMVFAFLFGLSMDYEVFILSRVREEYDAGRSTDEAVVEGIGRTGRLVTCAALILFLAFAALASGTGHRPEDAGHRARHRHPARRHDRALGARPLAGVAVRVVELVPARRRGAAAAGRAVPRPRRDATSRPRSERGARGRAGRLTGEPRHP